MSSRNRVSNSSVSKVDHPILALKESYDEQIVPLLTTIDQIRNRVGDIDATIDLPAIVVIGEQSSGKSSVLEALSGIPLPRGGQHMTTKCPLELRMRRSSTWHASLECSGHMIRDNILSPKDIGPLIIQEQNRLTHGRDQICKQVLLLNVQAPWLPNLTLIDLPGIIQVTSKHQDSELVILIEELIQDYLDKPSTIILAIIQACNDIETSAAIKYAKMFDPEGERTIGVLTKLDLVDRGVEQKLLEVFDNKRIPLKLGYLMVKCRSQEDIDNNIDLSEALRKEEQFFSRSSQFQTASGDRRGCKSLARFLTHQLVDNIKQAVPRLISDLRTKIHQVEQQFRQLGVDDYTQLLLTNDARSRYLTEKLFSAMQLFRTEIHAVEEGSQVNNPLYAKRNELNQEFFTDMHNCKLDGMKLIQSIKAAMIATQGPEPSDYILFRVTKTVCLDYVKAIRLPMNRYLSKMLERTHDVIFNVINKVFSIRPHLLSRMQSMHDNIEKQLKIECQRELDLILEMEQSFVYADSPLYQETLARMKKTHKLNSNEMPSVTTVVSHSSRLPLTANNHGAANSITTLKRTSGALSEDNDDDEHETTYNPPVKISRPSHATSNRLSSYIRPTIPTSSNDNQINEEILEYKIRILTMQDIICQRIVLTFPQRIEYQLVRKQFSQLDLQSSILSSTSLEQLDHLMAQDPESERRQNDLIKKQKLYDETIRELQKLGQHQANST